MAPSAIAQPAQPDPDQAPAWMPFADLAEPLKALGKQCAGLDDDVQRVIREVGATEDALIAETEQAFSRLRQAYQITAGLSDEQTAKVLRRVREHADRRPAGFQPREQVG